MNRRLSLILLILSTLVLFLYPFLLIANIMGIAAGFNLSEASLLNITALLFMYFSSAYPLALSIGWIKWAIDKKKEKTYAALIPLGHLVLSILLLLFWMFAEGL